MIKPYLYYEIRNTYRDTYEYGTTGNRDSYPNTHAKKPLDKAKNYKEDPTSVRAILVGELRRRP